MKASRPWRGRYLRCCLAALDPLAVYVGEGDWAGSWAERWVDHLRSWDAFAAGSRP